MIYKILTVMMVFNLAGALWLFWLLFAPINLAEIHNIPFPVFPDEVRRGDKLHYEIEFTKYENIEVLTNKNIVCSDGNLVTLAPQDTNAPLGYHKAIGTIIVPDKVSDSECWIEFNTTYQINPIRTEKRHFRTMSFNVID